MWYNNQLTQSLNIQYPIIQAGMVGSTTAELVATVSNKGGLGYWSGLLYYKKLEQEIQKCKD